MESPLSIYSASPATPAQAYTTEAHIDLSRLRHNARILRGLASPAEVMAVVKANAYGHGATHIAHTLIEEGYQHFMVATLAEALHLRNQGIYAPILVAFPPLAANLPVYSAERLHVSVSTPSSCRDVIEYAQTEQQLEVHVKIDTGLRRLGLTRDDACAFFSAVSAYPSITIRGIWTHLATAGHSDTTFAERQIAQARSILSCVSEPRGYFHVGNTSSLIHQTPYVSPEPDMMYRSGGGLLGISAIPGRAREVGLLPVMTLKSYVLTTKWIKAGESVSYGRHWAAKEDTQIAVIGAGYADGYPGTFANETPDCRPMVTIKGRQYPIVGSVCMDMCIIDLGTSPNHTAVQPGDEVILFGDGGADITQIAALAGQKAYEITCGISSRVVKTYK